MDSSKYIALRKRGMIEQADIDKYMVCNREELFAMTCVNEPVLRTVAFHILSKRYLNEEVFTNHLLQKLSVEKCLYTRLEICRILELGNLNTAEKMIEYLGTIGDNQYKELPNRSSKKESYPLPRDIIARTLANMDVAIFPILITCLSTEMELVISEILDAIGYMVFYHQELTTEENLKSILDCMDRYQNQPVIYWKTITCLSAFPQKKAEVLLRNLIEESVESLFVEEAKRSLALISKNSRTR